MSRRYLGGFITANPTIPTASSASGAWTISQQLQYASTWPFGGPFNYIEDVFSTWLYTGTGATLSINNGIDLAGNGGLTWLKARTAASSNHNLIDTARGAGNYLISNNTNASAYSGSTAGLTSFNSNGFTLGTNYNNENNTGINYASWTFRKQPKFFDVVTWTGNGSTAQTISHNLGSTPGFIVTKATSATSAWWCFHRSLGDNIGIRLNVTNAQTNVGVNIWNVTSTTFQADSNLGLCDSGTTYVAYLFAHNAGGFGLTGADNVISCGSFTTDGSGSATINLGYEPQYLMIKASSTAQNWFTFDVMRGWSLTEQQVLRPNLSDAEFTAGWGNPTATGFYFNTAGLTPSATYIYMAIRRGPMKTPTLGTSVFYPTTYTETVAQGTAYTGGFPVDALFTKTRNAAFSTIVYDKLRGTNTTNNNILFTATTDAETTYGIPSWNFANNTGVNIGELSNNTSGRTNVIYQFRRAPGFFDIVCYTGTGSSTTYAHNLGVVPQMIIYRARVTDSGTGGQWAVLTSDNSGVYYFQLLNSNLGNIGTYTPAAALGLTASTFNPSIVGWNTSSINYVAYLFATVAGVSKVGSYTGTGAARTIDCGFTTGARFVLIKATSQAGSWYVWDTARGMTTGTDPSIQLNSTAVEQNFDNVNTVATGFQIVASPAFGINDSGQTYIFLAIA